MMMMIGASAQTTRTWDFTAWSEETLANLAEDAAKNTANTTADANWTSFEKTSSESATKGCYWQAITESGSVTANGKAIAELEGLTFTNTTARALAIATNYSSTSLGEYKGSKYLWLGSKNTNYFTISDVEDGSTIEVGIESHKPSEGRGIQLYIDQYTEGAYLKDPDGIAVTTPKTYEVQTWLVNAGDGDAHNIVVRNTNGCHLYYIKVTSPASETTSAKNAIAEQENGVIYDMAGKEVKNPLKDQMYIQNGKKFIKK